MLQALHPLAMGLLPGLQGLLCLELSASQTVRLQIQLLVMTGCDLQEVLCMRVVRAGDLSLETV